MANAVSPVSMPTGTPLAAPVYLVINDGSVVSTTNGIPVNVVAGTISAENPSVGVLGAAIPPDATLLGGSDGTNLQQLLVESASNRNLRIGVYNGTNEMTVDASGRVSVLGITNALPAGTNVIGHVIADSGSTTAVTQATAANLNATATIQITTGTSIAPGTNAVPILSSAATGYVAAFGSNAAALTANVDYLFKWGAGGTTQVNHIMIQNNSSINIEWDLDVATSAGSPVLSNTLGQNTLFLDVQTSVVHIQGNGTPNVNGTTGGNIVIRGWL